MKSNPSAAWLMGLLVPALGMMGCSDGDVPSSAVLPHGADVFHHIQVRGWGGAYAPHDGGEASWRGPDRPAQHSAR